ncbi:MAG: PEGA domain-containing protein [Myxococcota bacterium]
MLGRHHLFAWSLVGALALGVGGLDPVAHAAETKPAERLHEAAVVAYRAGRLRQAIELWSDALKLDANWKYAYNLANTLYEVDDPMAAWSAVQQASALGPPERYVGQVAELLSKVRARLFKDRAWLVLDVATPGATVTRNGARWAPPWDLWTTDSESRIEVSAPGYETFSATIAHRIGARTDQRIELTPVVVTPPVEHRKGRLVVRGTPLGARVSVDGVDVGALPLDPLELPLGTVAVRVSQPGFIAETGDVAISAEREASLDFALRRVPAPASDLATPGWITFGGGLALAALGTGFYLWADATRDDLRALNAAPADHGAPDYTAYEKRYAATRSAFDDRLLAGQILLVAGGAAVVTGVTLVLLDGRAPEPGDATIGVVPLAGGAALVGGATF